MTIDPATFGMSRRALDTPPTPTTGPADGATTQLDPKAVGKDMFLKLLVAQLKFQNPMEPVDSSQFMAQTAQFTMVEKLQAMAAQTEALVMGEASQRAAGLLGRQVTYVDDNGATQTGVVTGTKFGTDGPVLKLGSTEISLSDVREVAIAPTA
ncbi:MAG TPA: flagellar hook capping FlgD N-terminal domain-containing protein [Acidimicrobiia bacterium]|nr:flagellar hook capping FlgD N-terminal domain-containing protein [Acidimicrobiia bacterium]